MVTEEKKGMSKGCLIALIVGGILAILVIGLGIVCYVYQDELINWSLGKTTDIIAQEIKANLPQDVTEQEVDDVMNKFKEAIKEKRLNSGEIQKIALAFQNALNDKKIDSIEAKSLLDDIKETVGE